MSDTSSDEDSENESRHAKKIKSSNKQINDNQSGKILSLLF